MPKLKLTICSSATFYPRVIAFYGELESLGVEVILPKTAADMRAFGSKNVEAEISQVIAGLDANVKSQLIRGHFDEIARGDAILVMNYEKHGRPNYIGPNVLMEMSVAFYLKKKIYVLNGKPTDSPLIDEILGLEPVFLDGAIFKIER